MNLQDFKLEYLSFLAGWLFVFIKNTNPLKSLSILYFINYVFWTVVKILIVLGVLYLIFLYVRKRLLEGIKVGGINQQNPTSGNTVNSIDQKVEPESSLCGVLTQRGTRCRNKKSTCRFN